MSWFKKQLWAKTTPPLRVFKCIKGILLVTGNFDVGMRYWLYDGKHFRPADDPSNDFYDLIYTMYPDHFEELTKSSFFYKSAQTKPQSGSKGDKV